MKKEAAISIIRILKQVRLDAEFTQKELGERIGVSRETVIAIENLHPGTVDALKMNVITKWWVSCKFAAPLETKNLFSAIVKKAFSLE